MIAYGIYKAGKIIDIYLGKTAAEIVASHDKEYELREVTICENTDGYDEHERERIERSANRVNW